MQTGNMLEPLIARDKHGMADCFGTGDIREQAVNAKTENGRRDSRGHASTIASMQALGKSGCKILQALAHTKQSQANNSLARNV